VLFNSLAFFVFTAAFFAVWPFVCSNRRARYLAIASFSLVFYGFWDPRYVLVLVATCAADFSFARAMESYPSRRRLLLVASLVLNLGTLIAFKYAGFLAGLTDRAFHALGVRSALVATLPAFLRVLPPGISFYTFQSMSYAIDLWRGQVKPTRDFIQFVAFVSFFPQLVAGPIERASHLLGQFGTPRVFDDAKARDGLRQALWGYFKKVCIADHLGTMVNGVYANPGALDGGFVAAATVLFAFQIYCDFSAYSDIAIGTARMFGIDIMRNFAYPYFSRDMAEFWRRWHISLSTWFRDYVYVPLGGSRRSPTRNLWLTMLASGIWHGASLTFLVWGAWHAFWLSVERWTRWPERAASSVVGRVVAMPFVFLLTVLGWVFFRASSLTKAIGILTAMLTDVPNVRDLSLLPSYAPLVFFGVGIVVEVVSARVSKRAEPETPPTFARRFALSLGLAVMIALCIYFRGPGTAFIYFQF
jgi:alginate O-acetyltransferase complex protein AlgI